MKKIIALLLAALLLAGALMACGAKNFESGTAADSMAVNGKETAGESLYSSVSDSASSSTDVQYADQKLIKTVELRTETEDLEALLSALAEQIRTLGGYTEYQNVYNGSTYSYYRSRSAQLTVRIPADRLDGFLTQVEGVSNVISRIESVDDVTLQYVDTQSRVEALQAEHDRLVELMEKAEDLTDLLTIEERLTEVRYQLESVASQLRVLENQVSYATIELYIDEVEVYTEVEEPTVWHRVSTGFMDNLRDLGDALVDLFVWIVTYSPQLLILAGVITLIVWLCRRFFRKRRTPVVPPTEDKA